MVAVCVFLSFFYFVHWVFMSKWMSFDRKLSHFYDRAIIAVNHKRNTAHTHENRERWRRSPTKKEETTEAVVVVVKEVKKNSQSVRQPVSPSQFSTRQTVIDHKNECYKQKTTSIQHFNLIFVFVFIVVVVVAFFGQNTNNNDQIKLK